MKKEDIIETVSLINAWSFILLELFLFISLIYYTFNNHIFAYGCSILMIVIYFICTYIEDWIRKK